MGWFKKITKYFSKTEIVLWCSSVVLIVLSFLIFDRENYLSLVASLIGVTSLIYSAKGNPFGQLLMVIFSLLYGIISFTFAYYGEMITYLGMTMPMAIFALIAWLKNPYKNNKADYEKFEFPKPVKKHKKTTEFLCKLLTLSCLKTAPPPVAITSPLRIDISAITCASTLRK